MNDETPALTLAAIRVLNEIGEAPTGQIRLDKVYFDHASLEVQMDFEKRLNAAGATLDSDRDAWIIWWNRDEES